MSAADARKSEASLFETCFDGRVRVAKEFSIQPLIPVKPKGKPVVLYGRTGKDGRRVVVHIGAVAKNREEDDADGLCPSLHVDLWQLILVLLSIWQERSIAGGGEIHPTFNEVWRRFSGSEARASRSQREFVSRLWDELDALRMKVMIAGEPERVVDVVHYETVRRRLNTGTVGAHCISKFSFDLRFLDAVRYAHETQDIRLDVLCGLTSNYVRAAYLWLPSRAFSRPIRMAALSDRDSPVAESLRAQIVGIPSKQLLSELGCDPAARWMRKRILLQNGERSILWQLHGLPMLRQGVMLGVTSWDADDDFYVGVYAFASAEWRQSKPQRQRPGAKADGLLIESFLSGGGSREAYFHWLNQGPLPTVDEYQVDRLTRYGVEDVKRDMPFYRMVLALVGPDEFKTAVGFLSEAKINLSAGGLFRTFLLERVKLVAAVRTEQYLRQDAALR